MSTKTWFYREIWTKKNKLSSWLENHTIEDLMLDPCWDFAGVHSGQGVQNALEDGDRNVQVSSFLMGQRSLDTNFKSRQLQCRQTLKYNLYWTCISLVLN